MPSREELLQSIHPDMKLDKAFFLKIYGYEITWPGFAETALRALEDAGCSKARSYYTSIVDAYERKRDEEPKPVAKWLREKIDSDFEKRVKEYERKQGDEKRKQEITQNLTRDELTELCKRLLQEGIITSPEQFVTVLAEQEQ